MRNLLAFMAALVITFLGAGYFLNWYNISTSPGPDGRRTVTIDLNTKKIGQDIHKGTEKIQGMLEKGNKDKGTPTQGPVEGPVTTTPATPTSDLSGWWTPAAPPDPKSSRWDTRSPVLPPAEPWPPRRPYDDVPLVIPPVRDR